MSLITSIRTNTYNTVVPKMRSFTHHNLNESSFKGKEVSKKPDKQKSGLPWKKILLGAAVTAVVVEGVLRYNPVRKENIKKYKEIFTDPNKGKRNFWMIGARDEAIITEVANGNECARKLFKTLNCDGDKVLDYMNAKKKLERTEKNFIEGRYETYHKKGRTVKQEQASFFRHLEKLKARALELYDTNIKPLIKC